MTLQVEKAAGIGFCFGVKRAIAILERAARERGGVEMLGAVVHNQPVLQRLAGIGVRVAESMSDIQGDVVAISSHGVAPQLEQEIRSRRIDIMNTTCPFVRRAQVAARRLADSDFYTIIYGDADHPEVKGILGWAQGSGVATLDEGSVAGLGNLPRRLGVLSQTTQIPARFVEFVQRLIGLALVRDAELRVIDTICHDIRQRQAAALELACRVDLMLVIGGHTSANSHHLVELCSAATKTYLVETAEEVQLAWFRGLRHIGVTAGASTDEQTIREVLIRLEDLT